VQHWESRRQVAALRVRNRLGCALVQVEDWRTSTYAVRPSSNCVLNCSFMPHAAHAMGCVCAAAQQRGLLNLHLRRLHRPLRLQVCKFALDAQAQAQAEQQRELVHSLERARDALMEQAHPHLLTPMPHPSISTLAPFSPNFVGFRRFARVLIGQVVQRKQDLQTALRHLSAITTACDPKALKRWQCTVRTN
jgi:hypothetical protein